MKNRKKIYLSFFILILLLSSFTGCLEVPVLMVKVNISSSPDGNPEVKNVTAEQISTTVLSRSREQPPKFPGVYCRIMTQTGNSWSPSSFWSSVSYTGAGSYELMVDFEKPPNKGENLKLWIAVYDEGGDTLTSGYTMYEWK